MSIESVRAFLSQHAPDIEIIEKGESTATVVEAARAHGAEPAQIAKTLSLRVGTEVILLLLAGDARLDNRKYRARFGAKATMLGADEVPQWTGHPIGGVCPFGLPQDLAIFVDASLNRFDVVYPAAGAIHAAIAIAPGRLVELVGAQWVDVARRQGDTGG